jgi:hypothetical protein
MRPLLAALLLLAGCASSDGLIDTRTLDCGPGQDVTIGVALNTPSAGMEGTDDRLTTSVEVGNNSHEDIIVKAIRVESSDPGRRSRYAIDNSYRKFDKVVAPGDAEVFELPTSGRVVMQPQSVPYGGTLDLLVSVYLANGDQYRCKFDLPAPR